MFLIDLVRENLLFWWHNFFSMFSLFIWTFFVFQLIKAKFSFYFLTNFPGLHEFEAQKNDEVNEFRTKMRAFCEEKAQDRQSLPWQKWMEYSFPCELEPCCSLPQSLKTKNIKKIFINVKFEASDVSSSVVVFLSCHESYSPVCSN